MIITLLTEALKNRLKVAPEEGPYTNGLRKDLSDLLLINDQLEGMFRCYEDLADEIGTLQLVGRTAYVQEVSADGRMLKHLTKLVGFQHGMFLCECSDGRVISVLPVNLISISEAAPKVQL